MSNVKRTFLTAFIALQVLDVASTEWALAACGTCHEGNPVVAATMAQLGAWWWVPKMVLMLALVPALARGRVSFAAAACAFMAIVVVNNVVSS
ncbi:DUF5658 family protein [Bradyrhizobium sp. 150]|uniref:DUF5658 family protein n=1 Tax=Bradyrhizobium sp. 150 TaxID=2782625 RepID=UPI001FF8AF1F|nr:DUF5658 family protein [Bradyrhizobium sp. 150]MCK1671077.1 hypothetical protein [Bradyrhizobium sp. 150]